MDVLFIEQYNSPQRCTLQRVVGQDGHRVVPLHHQACHGLVQYLFIYLYCPPGRSTKDKSSTSFPLVSRQTESEGNNKCLYSNLSGRASRKKWLSVLGLRMAHWARRILSVTSGLSKMGMPTSTLLDWASRIPFASVMIRRETITPWPILARELEFDRIPAYGE